MTLSYEDISQAFVDYLTIAGIEGLSYGDFWRILKAEGAQLRGRNGKVQKDFVYRALTLDPRIEKSRPGFFRLAAVPPPTD